MLKKKSGVTTRITAEQSKVPVVYCYGHSLSLAKKTHLFGRCIRKHNGHSWWKMCPCKVLTKKRKLIGNNLRENRRRI